MTESAADPVEGKGTSLACDRTRLVGDRPGDERLAGARRPVEQDALRRLHADGLEQLRVA